MSKVEVRPLPNKRWHGKVGKDSFAQPKTIEVLYNNDKGRYETGLTEEEAEEYGKQLGVDLSAKGSPTEPHPFWSTKASWIALPNHTLIFDTTKPMDFVKVKNLKQSKLVANSMKDWEAGNAPEATHVIFDENEEVAVKASKVQLRNKAIKETSDLSADAKASLVQVLSNKTVKGKSPDFIDVELSAIIDEKPSELLQLVGMGKEEVTIRAQILEMLQKNILTKEGGSIYYMGELIAMDYESAVKWFKDPNNQRMKVVILEKLQK